MDIQERIKPVFIEDEMQKSYLDYSMSMITSRALPDVRDGLKPVHRRVLFGAHELGLQHNRATKKSARLVGDVIGKYHPHGDAPVYDALVRMTQDFSLRYPMIEGQGNFGSVDGDPPAAMRYTECRMTSLAEEMLADIEKDTVDFTPNYDDTMKEPVVMPTKVPFLLINGSTGIAVGMATNMAPHNLTEIMNALIACIDNPAIEFGELLKLVSGPDFPTGGTIYGNAGIIEAYKTGNGKVIVRAKAHMEGEPGDHEQVIITEIPYMINKATLLEKIAEHIRNKVIEGISFLRDESDRSGMRIVVGIKRDAFGEVVLNQLYKYTSLQSTFGINNLALVKKRPKVLPLRDMLFYFIEHRQEVVIRRTKHDLARAEDRRHILEGLRIAIDNIDEIIELIKTSASPDEAKARLQARFSFSDKQTQAILEMRLQRLTGLERDKIEAEFCELTALIAQLTEILQNPVRLMSVIREEFVDIRDRFGDARRTDIVLDSSDVGIEDMIADEDMVITMTRSGYIKRTPANTYRSQSRGGKGVLGMESKDDDFVQSLFVASAHSYILFFTTSGRCHWLKVYRIPEATRQSRGRAIINLLSLRPDEKIAACVTTKDFDDTHFIVAATERGVINKQPLAAYSNIRANGINAIGLDDGDRLIECRLTDGNKDIILGTAAGQAVRFHESAARELGRNTRGVRGISLRNSDRVVSMVTVEENYTILTVTEKGYGKRTAVSDYRKTNRGGSGIINIKCSERNGQVVALKGVSPDVELDAMLMTRQGIIIRCDANAISVIGRNTQGVRLIRLSDGDALIDVELCAKGENDDIAEKAIEEVASPEELANSTQEQAVETGPIIELDNDDDQKPGV